MAYDKALAKVAYDTAKRLKATDKILVALFEAGIVESGMRNLDHGDRDSVGFLQQRPSQGWGTREQCMDPVHATTMFVKKAQKLDPDNYATAGQLAQAVQVSAFPLKYDAVRLEAIALLREISGSDGGGFRIPEVGIDDIPGTPIDSFQDIRKLLGTITDPKTWVRIGLFVIGIALVIIGLFKVTGDNTLSESTKKAAKLVLLRKVSK